GALQRVRDGQTDQSPRAPRERAPLLARLIPSHELLEQVGAMLAHLREAREIVLVVVPHAFLTSLCVTSGLKHVCGSIAHGAGYAFISTDDLTDLRRVKYLSLASN